MKGMYSLDKPGEFKILVDLQYTGAMSHPTGGKNDIPNRLKRHFSVFNVPLPTDTSLQQIFGVIFSGRFNQVHTLSPCPPPPPFTARLVCSTLRDGDQAIA